LVSSLCGLLLSGSVVSGSAQSSQRVVNGTFEQGLKGWESSGAVHLETNNPLEGKISASIGPGTGSLLQRIRTGSGNDFTVSADIQSQAGNDFLFLLRFLDKHGSEVMRVDSLADMKPTKEDPNKFNHFMKAHPLTEWIEIAVLKKSSSGVVVMDQVGLEMVDENAAGLPATCDLDEAMQPFWMGRKVFNEAVLMVSQEGQPAAGRLMFQPSRILSVRDYGLTTNYSERQDWVAEGRALICTASSRMPSVRDEDLSKGELKWNSVGGKQIMVTYEHQDHWTHPLPAFFGPGLPNTLSKLKASARLRVVAYGDSITHGVGASRLSHMRPFLAPWPELFVRRLQTLYQDADIHLYNSAQSGATSSWAEKYAERMVASLNPDLVLIAFGQNDFWGVSSADFAKSITRVLQTVRKKNPKVEFLLVSTMRYDPAYTTNSQYWNVVSEYAARLKSMIGPGVQVVDMTSLSEWVYAAKKPKDCLNDPLHPNDYMARWYAQSAAAALDPASGCSFGSIQATNKPANASLTKSVMSLDPAPSSR
jgi:lysophospholipase L1-like esterase